MAARRAPLIKRKVKKPRVGKIAQFASDLKHMGDEPIYTSEELTGSKLIKCLNWYNYMYQKKDARDFLVEYFEHTARTDRVKALRKVPDSYMPLTAAWLARIMSQGGVLTQDSRTYFERVINETLTRDSSKGVIEEEESSDEEKKPEPASSPSKNRHSSIIGDIEELIDAGEAFSLYDYMKGLNVPASYGPKIAAYYEPVAAELESAQIDKEVAEGYKDKTKKWLKERAAFFRQLVEDAVRYSSNTKKARAPRRKKPISTEKKLRSFKYLKEYAPLKITSIDPAKIIGAQELWILNTKYSNLSVLRAQDGTGLDVKGTTIINLDPSSSVTKRAGRKVQVHTDNVLNSGKVRLRKLMDEVKGTPQRLQERINENTVLLRVS